MEKSHTQERVPFQPMRFEHHMMGVEFGRGGWNQRDVAEVERLGSIGFELVAVVPMSNGHLLFFKRRVA